MKEAVGRTRLGAPLGNSTRREFLVGLGLSAAAITVQAAIKPPHIGEHLHTCGAKNCDHLPDLEVSEGYRAHLESVISPFRKLVHPEMSNFKVNIQKSEKGIIGGIEHSDHSEFHIYLPDASPQNLYIGLQIAVHETAHLIDYSYNTYASRYLSYSMRERTNRIRYSPAELELVTESTYDKAGGGGHPQDGFDELFASTVDVLRFYPNEFMARLEAAGQDERRFVATTGLACMDALTNISAVTYPTPLNYEGLPFDSALITYLQAHGKAS